MWHCRHGLVSKCVIAVLVACSSANVFASPQLTLLADTQYPLDLEFFGPLQLDSLGNIYARTTYGVAKINSLGEVQQVFTAARPDFVIRLNNPQLGVPQSSVVLGDDFNFDVDDFGNLYVRGTENVVKISTNGNVQQLMGPTGGGLTGYSTKPITVDRQGDVYVIGRDTSNVFKIDQAGEVTVFLDENGVEGHRLNTPMSIVLDDANNKYIVSRDAIFKISSAGDVSLHVDLDSIFPDHSSFTWSINHLNIDSFGNFYFVESSNTSVLLRYSTTRGLERVLDVTGDGTGELVCAKEGDREHDPIVCNGYGNYLRSISSIHIDNAQNVYVLGRNSLNVLKVTPLGLVSEVADLTEIEHFTVQRVSSMAMDTMGKLYFLHAKQLGGGSGISLFSYSPMPHEGSNDFSLETPHSEIVHDVDGVSFLPAAYSFTSLVQDNSLPDSLAHLDTRTEAFSQLPWQGSEGDVHSSSDQADETIRTTLTYDGRSYIAEMKTSLASNKFTKLIKSISYFTEGKQVYSLENLEFPLENYVKYSNQELMSWLYLGNDVISGGARADILYGYEGHDILYGNAGDDQFFGGTGANIYYGGEGIDTVVYSGSTADFMLSKNPLTGSVSVQAKTGLKNPYIDLLEADVERIQFNDSLIATAAVNYWGELESPAVASLPAASPISVYRFFNTKDKAFFYTTNPDERTMILRNSGPNNRTDADWPYVFQGAKFQTADAYPGAVPLYRFYNTQTGHHFFTINENERAQIIANIQSKGWPFVEEGIAFEVYAEDPTPGELGKERPVYRYYSWSLNRHIFTSSEKEAAMLDSSGDWTYEGIGFYAEVLL